MQDLAKCVEGYCTRHMFADFEKAQLMELMLQNHDTLVEPLGSPEGDPDQAASSSLPNCERVRKVLQRKIAKRKAAQLNEFAHLENVVLNPTQQAVYDAVRVGSGFSAISGMGGTGKSLLVQRLTHELRKQGKTVLLCATTGVAAMRLSSYGVTAHSLFDLPVGNSKLGPLWCDSAARINLEEFDVLVIDEFSMMTNTVFNCVGYRWQQAVKAPDNGEGVCLTGAEAMAAAMKKHIILVGDHLQVRSISYLSTTVLC
jgi:DNA replication protein DnaC